MSPPCCVHVMQEVLKHLQGSIEEETPDSQGQIEILERLKGTVGVEAWHFFILKRHQYYWHAFIILLYSYYCYC